MRQGRLSKFLEAIMTDINKRLCELLGLPFDDDTGSLARAAVEFLAKEVNARRNINARVISPTGSRCSSPATTTINKGLL